jgi:hypothetical protein
VICQYVTTRLWPSTIHDVCGEESVIRDCRIGFRRIEDTTDSKYAGPAAAHLDVVSLIFGWPSPDLDAGLGQAYCDHCGSGDFPLVRLTSVGP